MKEDYIKEALIEAYENGSLREYDTFYDWEPEAHYSFYGKRGVADLFAKYHSAEEDHEDAMKHAVVHEIKTQLREPHKMMRQFNRMVYAFMEDDRRDMRGHVYYELTVAPTKQNL